MAGDPVRRKWTIDEYLAYEDETGIKHEYIDGDIYAMIGGTSRHNMISANVIIEIGQKLRGTGCRAYPSDMRIFISDTKYVYPDMSVVCGKAVFADDKELMLKNPAMVVEVMSPSSEDYDQGTKANFYMSLESLQIYLLLHQDKQRALLYTRGDDRWIRREFTADDAVLPLDTLDISVPLSDLYLDVDFDED
jgi:Uma2 family endonuclease